MRSVAIAFLSVAGCARRDFATRKLRLSDGVFKISHSIDPVKSLASFVLAGNWRVAPTWDRRGARRFESGALSSQIADAAESSPDSIQQGISGFVDTHCHLDKILPRLFRQSERDIRKAKAKGKEFPQQIPEDFADWRATLVGPEGDLEACVTIGCSAASLDLAADFLKYDNVHGAFGIHPLDAEGWSDAVEAKLVKMMARDKVVAWGECGLDFYDKETKGQLQDLGIRSLQRRVFARQMDLAVSLNKPLIVHTRDAEEDTLELMKNHLPRSHKIHVHCFTSSLTLALALLEHFPNLHLGFTGVITFKNARAQQDVVKAIPLERILLETDGPYMAPVPFRGRVSHPGYVTYVADKIAELKGVPRQEVLLRCRENTRFVYGL